jgi:hypothetical protein
MTYSNFNRHEHMTPTLVSVVSELGYTIECNETRNKVLGLLDGFYYNDLSEKIRELYEDNEIDRLTYKVANHVLYVCGGYPKITEQDVHMINLM